LNCLIYRLETGQSFLRGRSFCPECRHKLGFFDLIPILSFIILKGKCRYCHQRISFQYPIVEIATGLMFLLIFNFKLSPPATSMLPGEVFRILDLLYLLIVSCFLIVIFVYDLKHYIIPDKIIYPAIATALIFNYAQRSPAALMLPGNISNFYSSILSAIGAAGFFFLLWLVSRGRYMGFGDVKLGFLIGLFLGWPSILVAMFSAFFIGAIIGLGLIVLGKKTLKSQVPFGPFLVIGTFIALFWGEKIIRWYLSLI